MKATARLARLAPRIEPLEARIAPAYTATLSGVIATFTGTAASDTITFSQSGGLLTHSRGGDAGFNSAFDFNSAVAGDQTLAAQVSSAVTVNTGGGNDTVNIGTASVAGSSLLAAFSINNSGQDGDTINIDDSASSVAKTINITSVAVSGGGINVTRGGAGYNGGIVVRTGSGADTVSVSSVASTGVFIEPTLIFTNAGNDTINIDPSSNSLDTFGQGITVDAGPDNDTLNVDDAADATGNTYTITPTSFTRSGLVGPFQFNSTLENLVLNAGGGGDTFNVTASASTEFTILAGGENDTLSYRSSGVPATRTPESGVDGSISAAGLADVNFNGTETTLINVATWDGGGANSRWTTAQNWVGDVAPSAGDTLIFPAGAARLLNVNDFPDGTLFASLVFTGDGYVLDPLAGGPHGIALANGIVFDVPAGAGFVPDVRVPITLVADQTFTSIGSRQGALQGEVNLNGRALTLDGAANLLITGAIIGAGSITKNGTGTGIISGANTFTGPVLINAGTVQISTEGALGAAGGEGNGTSIATGASLQVQGTNLAVAEAIRLSGSMVSSFFNSSAKFNGPITLTGDASINGTLSFFGGIGEEAPGFGLSVGGFGPVVFGGVNTYTGGTILNGLFANVRVDGQIGDVILNGGTLTGTGVVGAISRIGQSPNVAPGNPTGVLSSGNVDLNETTFLVDINGGNPGAFDQLNVTGSVKLIGGRLSANVGFALAIGDSFIVIANDGTDAVEGTFNGRPEGAISPTAGGGFLRISYSGGDGNDVVLTTVAPEVALGKNNRTATFIDGDGDLVTIKTNRGGFGQDDFTLAFVVRDGLVVGSQLQRINLSDDADEFAGANLTVTAKRGPAGGDGFVNVGAIDSTGFDLGSVIIGGDLGQIDAGDGLPMKRAMAALTVHSLGMLGLSTQAAGGSLTSTISGQLGKLTVKTSVRDTQFVVTGGPHGDIGSLVIGGSLLGGAGFQSGCFRLDGDIGLVRIGGDVRGGAGSESGGIIATGNVGAVQLRGSLFGGAGAASGVIVSTEGAVKSVSIGGSVFGGTTPFVSAGIIGAGTQLGAVKIAGSIVGTAANAVSILGTGLQGAPSAGLDLAIKSLTVGGGAAFLFLGGGYSVSSSQGVNADAAVGPIKIGGDLIASILVAGVDDGIDGIFGTADDVKLSGGSVRDNDQISSRIASITVKGQVQGTPGLVSPSDGFGIVAEQIGALKIGVTKIPVTKGIDVIPLGVTADFLAREDV